MWILPNVKANHREKTEHPCQFPIALIERLILALTEPGDLVVDPCRGGHHHRRGGAYRTRGAARIPWRSTSTSPVSAYSKQRRARSPTGR